MSIAKSQGWDKVISARHKLFDLRLSEVLEYRDLMLLFIKRDLVVQYKQTVLGPLWFILQPLFSTVMYTFVFGRLANLGTDGVPYLLFYYGGTMLWTYFSTTLTGVANTFLENAAVFSKVYFPRLTVPVSKTVGLVVKLLIQFVILMIFYTYYLVKGAGLHPSLWVCAFPLLIVWIGVLGCSFGMIISSLTTKYRDLNQLLSFGMSLLMYATPVVYPLSQAPQKFRWLFFVNPMSAPVELFRVWFYGAGAVPAEMVLLSVAITALALFAGLVLFTRNERTFVDVI
ncbi:MAG TPA: ABC transporter permease [Treponema sp.]|nr:ABC transporter permease [Treponema sp.]